MARQALAMSALRVAETMGSVTVSYVRPHMQAWALRLIMRKPDFFKVPHCTWPGTSMPSASDCPPQVSHAKQTRNLKRAARSTVKALVGNSLSAVFRAWKQMKLSQYQTLVAKLHQRDREYSDLHVLSESFFHCSREGAERLKRMESAMLAADRALQKLAAFCHSFRNFTRIGEARAS